MKFGWLWPCSIVNIRDSLISVLKTSCIEQKERLARNRCVPGSTFTLCNIVLQIVRQVRGGTGCWWKLSPVVDVCSAPATHNTWREKAPRSTLPWTNYQNSVATSLSGTANG